jgi:protein involved in polysaccharide export with SLBB domain/capsular polysaccharide biosynthesis protein
MSEGGAAGGPGGAAGGVGLVLPFDPLRLVAALLRRWYWVVLCGVSAAAPAAYFALKRFETKYTATAQLIRRELPNSFRASDVGEAFKPRQLNTPTVVNIMRSPSLLQKVAAQAKPRQSARGLEAALTITPEKNTDLITIVLMLPGSREAVASLINAYANEVVRMTAALQMEESEDLDRFLREQLSRTDTELGEVNRELLAFTREQNFYNEQQELQAYLKDLGDVEMRIQSTRIDFETIDFRIQSLEKEMARQNPILVKLAAAKSQLADLRLRYMDANPAVEELVEKVKGLEEQAKQAAASTNTTVEPAPGEVGVASSLYVDLVNLKGQKAALEQQVKKLGEFRTQVQAKLQGVPDKGLRYARIKARQQSLETTRLLLAGRQREAQLFAQNSPGLYRLFAPVTPSDVVASSLVKKVAIVGIGCGVLGAGLALVLVLGIELFDTRLLTAADLRRAIRAPVLGRLGDLGKMDAAAVERWRFRFWANLVRRLGLKEDEGLTMALTSGQPGEGRSTWLQLLAEAAQDRGWQALTIGNQPPPGRSTDTLDLETALRNPERVVTLLDGSSEGRVFVHTPTDVRWDRNHRALLARALSVWKGAARRLVAVELPPASSLETVMAAEPFPHVLWVASSGQGEIDDVAEPVATLRVAECRLSGGLLNREPPLYARMPDLSRFGLILATGLGLAAGLGKVACPAAEGAEPGATGTTEAAATIINANTNLTLSATAGGPQLARWQDRLTLGPGDIVNLSVYGRRDLTRSEVPVGPDGRLNYLEVQGLKAAGLTIDELREQLTAEIGKYYRHAQVIVTPFAWRSKKYYLLGTILDRGAYPLDRPLTIIEATARARGLATGLLDLNTVEIADLARTFLIRNGQRVPVDFVRLFQEGDLSQNIQLEPGDYIYFPSATVNEVYVLGAVGSPGTMGVTDRATVLGVITVRGGFTPKAYKQRVLVVRGALTRPETFVVNLGAVLAGKERDFPIRPKDIIYVADRPWARVEELLDLAVSTFTQAATAEWTSMNMGPWITSPILPSVK